MLGLGSVARTRWEPLAARDLFEADAYGPPAFPAGRLPRQGVEMLGNIYTM